jgi:hypothetical protein
LCYCGIALLRRVIDDVSCGGTVVFFFTKSPLVPMASPWSRKSLSQDSSLAGDNEMAQDRDCNDGVRVRRLESGTRCPCILQRRGQQQGTFVESLPTSKAFATGRAGAAWGSSCDTSRSFGGEAAADVCHWQQEEAGRGMYTNSCCCNKVCSGPSLFVLMCGIVSGTTVMLLAIIHVKSGASFSIFLQSKRCNTSCSSISRELFKLCACNYLTIDCACVCDRALLSMQRRARSAP